MQRIKNDLALRTAIIYGVGGSLWIILSDNLLGDIVSDQSALTQMQTYKGWVFVSVTTILLYLGLRKSIITLKGETELRNQAEERLMELNLQLEERVRVRTTQLEESHNEMEAFISSVSHELRAPLRSIRSFIDILSEEAAPNLSAEDTRIMGIIKDSATQMQQLIDDLHRLSNVSRGVMSTENISMKEMVIALSNEMKAIPGNAKVSFEIGEMPDVMADSNLLKQVWINIVSNAIKFSSLKSEPVIKIGGRTEREYAVFCVSDNGVGFNPEYTKNLFLVFSRLHSRTEFEGTGVGLSVVRRIVQRHGGRVWAKGEEGKGAEFCFSLPLNAGF